MQLTIQSIVGNLTTSRSEELMRSQVSDDRFPDVWSTFMVCRHLSFTAYGKSILPLMNDVCEIGDKKLAYEILFRACMDAERAGGASFYRPSPFTE